MGNWLQDLLAQEEHEKKTRLALEKPFGMVLTSVASDSEIAKFSYHGANNREVPLPHPFISPGSWIRAIPEAGATFVSTFRADEPMPQPIGMYQRQTKDRISAYKDGLGVYRPLLPGEIEISSGGLGQAYFGSRARAEVKASVLTRGADLDTLTSFDRAPVHTKQLLQHQSGFLGDEYRLGVISRPKIKKGFGLNDKSTWQMSYPKLEGNFTAEEYLMLKNPANENPAILVRSQKGHVLDEDGNQILQNVTQVPLRYLEEFYSNEDSPTFTQCDEKGNWYMELSASAVEGFEINVPTGFYRKFVAKDDVETIGENKTVAVGINQTSTIGNNLKYLVQNNVEIVSENGGANFVMDSTPEAEKVVLFTKSGHSMVYDDTPESEAIYFIHKSGSQIVIDETSSIKMISKSGNLFFIDDTEGGLTLTSKFGALATLKEAVTFSDKSGKQIISLDGSNAIQISAGGEVVVNAPSVSVASGSVNIGNNASLSATLAEPLAVLFDSHIHAGVMGPTSPPLPPNTAALINANPATAFSSSYVKVRGNLV
jgi:hypothetical protein